MSTSDPTGSQPEQDSQLILGWPLAPVGQPWRGSTTDRPPWEQPPPPTDAETTQRIPIVPGPPVTPPTGPPQQVPLIKSADLVGHVPHGDTALKRISRVVTRAFSSSKQSRELEEALAALQAPVATGRRIAVTSIRGGAGKTAITALLGSVFAVRRPEPVLALDADPENGSLAWRLGVESTMALAGLAPALQIASGQDLASVARLLSRTSRGLWVAPGGSAGQPELARDAARALSRLFAVAVLDCTTGPNTPSTSAVVGDAHAVVVVTPATPDGVRTTAAALDRMADSGGSALSRVVIALNTIDSHGRGTLKRSAAEAAFARHGLPVETLPYDRHVAVGAALDPGKLAEPTLTAASRLAAWVLARAQRA